MLDLVLTGFGAIRRVTKLHPQSLFHDAKVVFRVDTSPVVEPNKVLDFVIFLVERTVEILVVVGELVLRVIGAEGDVGRGGIARAGAAGGYSSLE